ncbi:uncharacterized protein PFL1_06313 [Pseudozyma flocculosa PF-1]|uniref:Uncharacterized protein n=2 Tax=Pseudozyma flocculosa TaxID=84751 RepID=A0A5C3FA96_9BASI|nr:uncharacterized protein PFL1_06313 [Pseudozyma flocculosa PF-1]EPQ26105.1 hypothetical protein PFL1_06313 [Pseudozyma flocculosa PF-1]SPO40351.1 uncharacterized protein PSFLO_05833 [Pseudozyma flocculosa]
MPSSLPDPVLALSMDNVQKLNDLDLDQLANLWNVFTKCKESLESGRRLENLSWRLWFREAHLLPPDVALSDLTDFTPLDTPLLSRANSVAGSYQHSRLSSLLGQASAALSDPEPESDSSSDSDAEAAAATAASSSRQANLAPARRKKAATNDRAAAQTSPRKERTQPEAGPSRQQRKARASRSSGGNSSVKQASRRDVEVSGSLSQQQQQQQQQQSMAEQASERDSLWDRKRAVSSSSAFGSRARVKQRNQSVSRRRPLSFQMAIESLYLDSTSRDSLSALVRTARPGLSRMSSEMISSTGAIDAPQRPSSGDAFEAAERFSAPAEYSSTAASSAHSPAAIQRTEAAAFGRSVEPCRAPETAGPMSPSKMNIATAPTVGAISRTASPGPVAASSSAALSQHDEEAARLMPPPASIPPKASKPTSEAQASAHAGSRQPSSTTKRKPAPSAEDLEQTAAQDAAPSSAAAAAAQPVEEQKQRIGGASAAFYLASPESSSSVASNRRPSEANGSAITSSTPAEPARQEGTAKPAAKAAAAASKPKARDGHAPQLHAGHRSKSSTGLHRDHRHHKSTDRLPVKRNSQVRLGNVFSGLTMTKAAPAPAAAPAQKGKLAATAAPTAGAHNANKKKQPVQFTMGGDDSDSFEDEDDEDLIEEAAAPAEAKGPAPTEVVEAADADDGFEDEDDDEEWASDPEAEEAERQAQAAAAAERRRREEEEHQRSMFQKIPIRSKSAADVRLALPQEQTSAGPSPPQQPVRGLLSSLFHPDEQHSPPGQLAGRPHASAADLRAKPSLSSGLALSQKAAASKRRPRSRENASSGATGSTSTSGSGIQAGPFSGGLRTSKSAVALPLLDTSVTRSSTGGGKARQQQQQQQQESQHSQQTNALGRRASDPQGSIDDGASNSSHGSTGGKPSSVAMAKLNALAHMRSHADRDRSGQAGVDAATREAESRAMRLEVSPSNDDIEESGAGLPNHLQAQQQQQQPYHHGMGARSKSENASAGPMAAPALSRHRSSLDLPETAAPQTPRTTRRNMLRDELSESLRQNLLWERQSRTRMLGIGTKKETVLGGNQLRPLTSAHPAGSGSGSAQQQQQQQPNAKPKRYSEEWGSFHHKGW